MVRRTHFHGAARDVYVYCALQTNGLNKREKISQIGQILQPPEQCLGNPLQRILVEPPGWPEKTEQVLAHFVVGVKALAIIQVKALPIVNSIAIGRVLLRAEVHRWTEYYNMGVEINVYVDVQSLPTDTNLLSRVY